MAIALVHHPVLDRRGDVVTSAVTNLDIHDLARLATTYNLSRYYLVTPAAEQTPTPTPPIQLDGNFWQGLIATQRIMEREERSRRYSNFSLQ